MTTDTKTAEPAAQAPASPPPTSPTTAGALVPVKPQSTSGDTNRKDSVAAVVTFWLLGIWTIIIGWILVLVTNETKIEGAVLGVLAGIIGTQTTFTATAIGFWLATSIGAKASGDALAQLAGAGPQTPALPMQLPAPVAEPTPVPQEEKP